MQIEMRQNFGTRQTIVYSKVAALLLAATLSVTACRQGEKPPAAIAAKPADPQEAIREEVGPLPDTVISPPGNPATPEKIELGRLLFYDPILSGQKDVSCASCHHPNYGYAESQEISIGVNGLGLGEMRTFKDPGKAAFARRNAHT
ncbi:MAG: cytochrome-c peroxidase, partial [Adhaeribacter sp.]